jgi:soluble lytic murein transglycosylase-like protein
MEDPISRVQARVQQIQSLLGEGAPPNEEFGAAIEQAAGAVTSRHAGSSASAVQSAVPPPMEPAAIAPAIEAAAGQTGLSEELISAVIAAESAYRPNAVSSAGAQGLMQLMPGTAHSLGVQDPFDPFQNVLGGSRYLQQQLQRFGSVEKALAAYNAGPGAVERYGGIPPYRETQNYVRRVMQLLHRLTQQRE